MNSNYKWTIRFSILTPVLILICIFLMGGGHGWYIPTFVTFPWATFNTIWQDQLSKILLIIGIFQFPVYGIMIDKSKGSKRKLVVFGVIVTHIFLAIMILSFKNPEWR